MYGKVQEIDFPPPITGAKECIKFVYDPMGNRLEKIHYKSMPVYCYLCSSPPIITADTTKYIRDAQGNILSIYTRNHDSVKMNEWDIYGSKRIGVLDSNITLYYPPPPPCPLCIYSHINPYDTSFTEYAAKHNLTIQTGYGVLFKPGTTVNDIFSKSNQKNNESAVNAILGKITDNGTKSKQPSDNYNSNKAKASDK